MVSFDKASNRCHCMNGDMLECVGYPETRGIYTTSSMWLFIPRKKQVAISRHAQLSKFRIFGGRPTANSSQIFQKYGLVLLKSKNANSSEWDGLVR